MKALTFVFLLSFILLVSGIELKKDNHERHRRAAVDNVAEMDEISRSNGKPNCTRKIHFFFI